MCPRDGFPFADENWESLKKKFLRALLPIQFECEML
jgi:hypothetical protein